MDRVALNLGFIQIYWYSIFIFIGVIVASILILKEARKFEIKEDNIVNLVFYGVIFGLIGARIYYCLFNLDYYLKYPVEILEVWNGGLAIHGGLIAGIIFIYFYTKKKKMNLLKITDIIAPNLLIAQAIGRWGNFFNQEAYGKLTTRIALENMHLPNFIIDGMHINGKYYQPTFLFESIWNIIGFIIILIIRKKDKYLKNGQLTCLYLMWYSFGRFFIEILRSDSLYLGQIKVAQLVSIILFICGLIVYLYLDKNRTYENIYHDEVKKFNF